MTDRYTSKSETEEMSEMNQQPSQESETPTGAAPEQSGAENGASQQEQAAAADAAPSLAELEQRIAQIELQAEEYRENWMRTAADFRNLKRRTELERQEMIKNAGAGLILKLLPILDDLERALGHVPEEIAGHSWFEGIKLVQRKFLMILEGEGVRPIEALGQEFDPNQHEAVMYEEVGPEQSGKVTAELQKGYKLGDRVLRPTMVKVGR